MRKKLKPSHDKFKKKSNKELYDYINKAKKQEKAERQTYLEALSNQLRLPSDMLAGAPIITAIGRNELYVENYKGIIEYNDSIIRVLTGIGRVQIEGKNLNIDFLTNDEMKITGMVHNIQYYTGKDDTMNN
jgi:sporulation protein YqfC